MPGIGIVLNPHSRSNKRNPGRAHRLGFIVGDKGSCHITDEISQIRQLAETFKQREVEILGISGGDGTYHHTLTTFIDVYGTTPLPKICFLRGGTMNLIANNLGIKGTPESILSRLIYQYHQDIPFQTVPLSVLKINEDYGCVFSVGMLHNFVKIFYQTKNPTRWDAVCLLIKGTLLALLNTKWAGELCRRFDATVTVDGKPWPFKNYVDVFGGTVKSIGLGFRPFYRLKNNPGHFQLLGFSAQPRSIVWRFPRLLMGKPTGSEDFIDGLAQTVTIEFAKPQGYFVDGEMYEPTQRIAITMGPKIEAIIP